MGYREDGNFKINWKNDGLSSNNNYKKENSKSLFPDNGIRFLQAQAALDKLFNRKGTISDGDYKIHRGYLRNLEQPAFGEVPIMRCNFQFNPQQIQQSVAMRDDIYLPLLQPPEQLSQPIGANTNFSFDLFFDRSHELAKGTPESGIGYSGTADSAERVSPSFAADSVESNANDPYDIGVLGDLRVFYSAIGQGFSKEMLDFQSKMFQYDAKNKVDNQTQPPAGDGGSESSDDDSATSTTTDQPPPDTSLENIQSILAANYGNFALLMPNPVRVVFSSLFMVDGFITSTNVDFLKFSGNMVPVQCRIGVTMNAMYIGFAKQKTFLTDTFEKAAVEAERKRVEDAATTSELMSALTRSCNRFLFASAFEDDVTWNDAAKNPKAGADSLPVWALAVDDMYAKSIYDTDRRIFTGFPSIIPKRGNGDQSSDSGTVSGEGSGKDIDSILTLYENSSPVSIQYTWSINVWGRKSNPLTLAQATSFINKTDELQLVGTFGVTETCASKDQWGSGTSGNGVRKERVRRRTYDKNYDAPNKATDRWRGTGTASSEGVPTTGFKSSYFIVEATVSLSASLGNIEPITASWSSGKKVFNGNAPAIEYNIPLSWSAGVEYDPSSGLLSTGTTTVSTGTTTVPSIPVNRVYDSGSIQRSSTIGSGTSRPLSPEERRALGREQDNPNILKGVN